MNMCQSNRLPLVKLVLLTVAFLTILLVLPASAQFQVTAVGLSASPTSYNGPCPGTIKFTGKIAVNGKGEVKYQFYRNDGAAGPVLTLAFEGAGSKEISTTWTLGGPGLPTYEGWQIVKIIYPNAMESNKAMFKLNCTNVANPNGTAPGQGQPDITSKRGLKIGSKFVKWGGSIKLSKADAVLESNGNYAFNLSYDIVNTGSVATLPAFGNRLRDDGGNVVTQQSALSLNAGETKQINTQAYLLQGTHQYKLSLDDDGVVTESNEANNTFVVTITFTP